MPYTPDNNPYVPGDPYSYDLKWMVEEVKKAQAVGEEAAASAEAAADSAEAAGDSAYNAATSASNALIFSQNAEASAENAADSAETAAGVVAPITQALNTQGQQISVLEGRMDTFASLDEGSTAADAELQDIRVAADGTVYPTAGDAVRGQITNINNALLDEVQNEITWTKGTLASDHIRIEASNIRLVTCEYIPLSDVSVSATGKFGLHLYDETYTWLGLLGSGYIRKATIGEMLAAFPTAKYMRLVFAHNADSQEVDISDIVTYSLIIKENIVYKEAADALRKADVIASDVVINGGLNINGGDYVNNLRVKMPSYYAVEPNTEYIVFITPAESVTRDLMFSFSYYEIPDFLTYRTGFTDFIPNNTIIKTGASDRFIRVLAGFTDNSQISASDIKNITVCKYRHVATDVPSGYALGADLLKRNVFAKMLGNLTQRQSFCKYNGFYYSTNGSNLTKQNEDFSVVNTVSINLGHGNSLQLGSNGKAYSSGWDDNTVYIVDLETMAVEGTIQLPTTGYTTAVIDDKKGLAYIFQRDSYPTTEAQYNFIVYDYVNQQTIRTAKTAPFTSLQSCDLYMDRIIALNGGGTASMPNGYRVYDTFGNIISDYVLPNFSTLEPEGVCIERETGTLMLSFNTRNVYEIAAL